MLTELYVREKLQQLDAERARRAPPRPPFTPMPMVGPLARAAGRVLRRVGEGLESWSAPSVLEGEGAHLLAPGQTGAPPFRAREEGC